MNQSEWTEQEIQETESTETTGFGGLLRDEREKKGLSYAQISEKIRLRPSILEALENEDWRRLPAPVFVRGFIRAYARVLGVEQAKAVKLYQEAAHPETAKPNLVERPPKTRKKLYLSLAAISIAVAFALYLWKGYPSHDKGLTNSESLRTVERPAKAIHMENLKPSDGQMEMPAPSMPDKAPEEIVSDESISLEEAEPPPSTAPASPMESGPYPYAEAPDLTLEIDARERTWVRIFVDDQEPKDYMFRPGDHLEWRAKKGFEILVGNAGGIELEFNNTAIIDLGSHGEVVRLRLPESYKRTILQD